MAALPQNNQKQSQSAPQKQGPMYDQNGNKIIQGNGKFEQAQRLAMGQPDPNQGFKDVTGQYDMGQVINQVNQNAAQPAPQKQPQPVQPNGLGFTSRGNRRADAAFNYLNNTFANKTIKLDDGKTVPASEYFKQQLSDVVKGSNNPAALKHYLRGLQEDMARRGVGNFDISGELLKGTGMTDGGFAKYLFNNKADFMMKDPDTNTAPKPAPKPPAPPKPPVPPVPPKPSTVPDAAASRNANMATGVAAKYGAQANMHPRAIKTDYMPGSYDDNMAQYNAYAQKLALITGPVGSYENLNPADRKKYDLIQSHMDYFQKAAMTAKQNQKQAGDWYSPGKAALGGTEALGGAAATALGAPAPLGIAAGIDGARRFKNGITRKQYVRSNK